ncbi:hypothetical protein GL325_08155 [Aeromicrobium sp. 636]|uniref:50S ribosome-binding GTPase n=1 Tax=Aeromicrobium senzhongii TaxID=2663859 RepID=A0A8I0EUC4_9ACTN|nr:MULTISPECIES: GTPase [Aeromicrobium]MBC9226289.1 50S ribosome-binding GTPase [Aeromicrobium senzhongii]MCQ3998395.1 hypothetical protein [Aeromicrobium sp. 636]
MSALDERVNALRSAIEAAGDVLDPAVAGPAEATFAHAKERLELSAEHTVVALVGSTGSGKSSLFNRLSGLELAEVGYLRPTTSTPLACAWGPAGATELLDWIGVARRDQIARRSILDAPRDDAFEGLVLLDLPDHDSVVQENHDVVDHVARYADLFVWVLDPQKYADAAIHEHYLAPLATHKDASLVVLNQADRLSDTDLKIAVDDLEQILEREGFGGVPVIATSAVTGAGLPELRAEIGRRISSKRASQARLVADVRQVAQRLAEVGGVEPVPGLDRPTRDALVETFVACAGVPQIADAVEDSMARRAVVATDWPLIGWVGRLRHDPLRELGFGRSARDAVAGTMPISPSVQRARADLALREATEAATEGMSRPWRASVIHAVVGEETRAVIDELDEAVAGVDLGLKHRPLWWTAVAGLQWLTMIAVVVGGAWCAASVFGLVDPDPWSGAPRPLGMSLPLMAVALGLLFAIALTLVSRWLGSVAARRAGARAEKALTEAINRTTERIVVARLRHEIDRYERWCSGLATAVR